jgi:hypothetical protein
LFITYIPLNEYYKEKNLEGIFHCPIELSQINDDRFGRFLDAFHEAALHRERNIEKTY